MLDRTSSNTPADHPPVRFGRVGVLIVNLGTPSGTGYGAMRRYLSEFLSDPRVIEYPRVLWQPILQLMVLTKRPFTSGAAYCSIWHEDSDESPLAYYTRETAQGLAQRFGPDIQVDYAMRYGAPSIPERFQAMKDAGCDRILVLPLYPQYSATTTATVVDKVAETLKGMRWQPALRIAPGFYDHPTYIDEVTKGIVATASQMSKRPDRVLLSFHGVPKSYLERGDPYHCFCQVTARLVGQALKPYGLEAEISFQSRFGPEEWLRPYTCDRLKDLPKEGVKNLLVATPGFVADCVETLEEIAQEGREDFLEAGGNTFAMSPCLNASDGAMRMYEALIGRELAGWARLPRQETPRALKAV